MATIPKIDRVGAQDIQGLQGVDPGRTNTSGLDVAGKAVEGFGQTVTKDVANDLAFIGAQDQVRDEDRIANEASNALKSAYIDRQFGSKDYQPAVSEETDQQGENVIRPARPAIGTPGWSTLQGSAAVDAQQDILTEAKELHEKNLNTLSGRTLDLYREKTSATILAYEASVSKHVSGQRDQAEETANEAAGKLAQRAFNLAPDAIDRDQHRIEIMDSVLSTLDRQGVTDPNAREVAVRERMSLVYKQAITAQLNFKTRGGNALAKELLAEGQKEELLTQKHLGELTKSVSDGLIVEEAQSVSDVAFANHPNNEQAARDYIKNNLTGEAREKALAMVGKEFAVNVRRERQLDKEAHKTGMDAALTGASVDTLPSDIQTRLGAKSIAWMNKVAQSVATGTPLISNPDDTRELYTMAVRQPELFAVVDIYTKRLNKTDLEKFLKLQRSVSNAEKKAEGQKLRTSAKETKSANNLVRIDRIINAYKPEKEDVGEDDRSGRLKMSWAEYSEARSIMLNLVEEATERNEALNPSQLEEMFKSISNQVKTDKFKKNMGIATNELRRGNTLQPESFKSDPEFAAQMRDLARNSNSTFNDTVIISMRLRQQGRVPTSQGIIKYKEQVRERRARRVAGQRRDVSNFFNPGGGRFTDDVPAPTGDRPLAPLDTSGIGEGITAAPVTPPGGVPEFTAEQEAAGRAADRLERAFRNAPGTLRKQVADQVYKEELEKVNEERAQQRAQQAAPAPAEVDEAPNPGALRRKEALREKKAESQSIIDELRQRAGFVKGDSAEIGKKVESFRATRSPDGTITGSGNDKPIKGDAGRDTIDQEFDFLRQEIAYQTRRNELIAKREKTELKAYDDNAKKRTVGTGFNLDAPGNKEQFKKVLGVDDAFLKSVYDGKTELTPAQAEKLFNATLDEAEKVVDSRFKGITLGPSERMAMVSMAFNLPILLGKDITRLLKAGDKQGVVNEILYRSNLTKNLGLARRRYEEATVFAQDNPGVKLPNEKTYLNSVKRK